MRDKSGGAKNDIKESKKAESDDEILSMLVTKSTTIVRYLLIIISFYHFTRNEVNYGCGVKP